MDLKKFEKLPLMGILRGIKTGDVKPLMEAVIDAGLQTIEITMNTPDASGLIQEACKAAGGRISVGAGTVLSTEEMEEAVGSGAEFIVMPANINEVTSRCLKRDIPVFPGAFTPQEVLNAWQTGASMVKVFPSGVFGPGYIKELKGPFDEIRLMAVGGVRPENIREYFDSGASAVAFGGSVFKKEWIAAKDFDAIGGLVRKYVKETKKIKASR